MGRARENRRYPVWSSWVGLTGLSVLHGVVSSVLSSSVVLCWSRCDYLQLSSRCDSSTGSVGSPAESVGSVGFWLFVLKCFFFFFEATDSPEKKKKNCLGRANDNVLMLSGSKVAVCVICCIRRCLSGWMLCLHWVSVFIWCWCELWACCRVSVAFFFVSEWAGDQA